MFNAFVQLFAIAFLTYAVFFIIPSLFEKNTVLKKHHCKQTH